MAGAEPAAEPATRRFLGAFRLVALHEGVAERAVELRRQLRLKLPDATIVATARIEGCMLVSGNTQGFRFGATRCPGALPAGLNSALPRPAHA